jgi:Skp family chaperone for outer membrane proteins
MRKVISESKAAKSIDDQIKKINENSRNDLKDLESQIKSLDSAKKTDDDSRKIEDMQIMLYDMVRSKKYQISEAHKKAIDVLEGEIKKIIAEICRSKKINMVINKDEMLYYDEGCSDITKEAINKLDEDKPHIPIKME